jgi:uncharacterized protein
MKRLVIAGGSGFLGNALARYFAQRGYEIVVLTRSHATGDADKSKRFVPWDARQVGRWAAELEAATAVINLTGRSVDCRYTEKNRRAIMDSRVESTRAIGQAIERCHEPPPLWLNASTATIYKHTFGTAWDENGEIGGTREAEDEFSIEVARAWESALSEAELPATRSVALRMAMVLGAGRNSVFPVLRRMVRLGLGGQLGNGQQFVSWIHELDFCRAVEWLIEHEDLAGPVNICAPNPLTNEEMMRTLREVLRVPVGLPASAWMVKFGAIFLRTEAELVLKSRRVVPGRLRKSGFQFAFPDFRSAVRDLVLPQRHGEHRAERNLLSSQ